MFARRKINPLVPPGPGDEMLTIWGHIIERIEFTILISKYRYKVEAYTIRREAEDWCKDNSIKASGVDKGGGYNKGGFYCFSFECEEDAMAFKLRWL